MVNDVLLTYRSFYFSGSFQMIFWTPIYLFSIQIYIYEQAVSHRVPLLKMVLNYIQYILKIV